MQTPQASAPAIMDMLETYKRIVELQTRLRTLRRQLDQSRAYLQETGGLNALARAQHERLVERWNDTLAALREADQDSRSLLGAA